MTAPYSVDAWCEPWLERRAALTPRARALSFEGCHLDYRALRAQARRLASELETLGVGAGDVVALLLPNGLAFARLFYALREVGAVLLPLNWRLAPGELGFQLRDSRARLLVHAPGKLEDLALAAAGEAPHLVRARLIETELQRVDGGKPATSAALSGAGRADTQGALAVLYTSGTSGRPKGALLGPESFLASAAGSADLLGAAASDRWLVCLPLFHVAGLSILLRSCLAGACAVIHERFDAAAASRALESDEITHVSLVANMLQRLLDERGERPSPPTLRCLLLGGGPAPPALLERALALGFPLAPTYGLTEAASQVATRLPGDGALPLDGRLRALRGNELQIADANGRPLGAGELGEIRLRGPTLMRGYLSDPDVSSPLSEAGWFGTGDIGRLDRDGLLQVLDRRDDLIVSGGENVYPAEVESVLLQHPFVMDAGVVGEPDEHYGQRPVAYWVAEPGISEAPALELFCRKHLAPYKVPVAFRQRQALPRSASGKLLRRLLRESC